MVGIVRGPKAKEAVHLVMYNSGKLRDQLIRQYQAGLRSLNSLTRRWQRSWLDRLDNTVSQTRPMLAGRTESTRRDEGQIHTLRNIVMLFQDTSLG